MGKCWGSNIRIFTPSGIFCYVGQGWAIAISVSPQAGAYTRALKTMPRRLGGRLQMTGALVHHVETMHDLC